MAELQVTDADLPAPSRSTPCPARWALPSWSPSADEERALRSVSGA